MTYEDFRSEWESESDTVDCHTSGSTGTPTLIKLPKEMMRQSARRTIDFFGLTSDATLYSCISPDFIGGKMMLVRQRKINCRLYWESPSNRPLENYKGGPIDLISVVPSQMIHILDNLHVMPELRNILIGGSSIPSGLRRRIAASGLNAWESYGMTETASHIALRRVMADPESFHTLPGVTVEDRNGALVINISGWKSLVTNDACRVLAPDEFEILGRLDNVIISGGKKINPEKLEERLSLSIEVPFFITSAPDEKWGSRVVLVAECNESRKEEIESVCHKHLEKHEVPKQIIFMERIPLTSNGKPIRNPARWNLSDI